MVDFRYHLISIVAVFLALGVGLLIGSGLLGERLVEGLRNEVSDVRATNQRLQGELADQDVRLRQLDASYDDIAPWIVDGELDGERIVVVTFQSTDGDFVTDVTASLEQAGGTVTSTIVVRDDVALAGDAVRAELAELLGSSSDDGDALALDLAEALGAGASAERSVAVEREPGVPEDFDAFLGALEDADLAEVTARDGAGAVPVGGDFVVVGGGDDEPAYDVESFVVALARALTEGDAPVVAAEPGNSAWNFVAALRREPDVASGVATVDNADSSLGRIAVVLALDEADRGAPGHYGYDAGAAGPVPDATPGA